MFPVNGFLIKKMGALQKVMMEAKDVRVKAVNEVLQGIRLIKFFNWESSFYDKIRDVRSVVSEPTSRFPSVFHTNQHQPSSRN